MANPTGPCSALQFSNTSLQQADITKAAQCSAEIIEASVDDLLDVEEIWDEWSMCWYYYLVVHYYSCSTGGCVYLYSDAPIYIGSSCS
jgi:hypothetical protein